MRRIFRMEEPIPEDKVIEIIGPDTFSMTIDYADVQQESVLTHARKMVKLSIPIGKGRPPSEPDAQVGEEIREGLTPVVLKFPFDPRLEICAAHSSLGAPKVGEK